MVDPQSGQDMSDKQLTSRTVFQSKLLHVVSDTVRLSNDRQAIREYILDPGASMISAMPDDSSVLLERRDV